MTAGVAWGWAAGVLGVVCLVLQFDSISCDPQRMFGIVNENITFYVPRSVSFTEIMWTKK